MSTVLDLVHSGHVDTFTSARTVSIGPICLRNTTIAFVSGYVRQQVDRLDLAPLASYAILAQLIPAFPRK